MKQPLVIFGASDLGQLAHYYFTRDSDYEVVAFTLDGEYIKEDHFCGLPMIPFEDLVQHYPPSSHSLFVALGYSRVNEIRRQKYLQGKALGYAMPSYVSSHATVLNDGKIGENCFILEDNTIQPFVTIGNNVTLWSGNHIGHHSTIEDHCFIASHIVISGGVTVKQACFLGVNATVRDRVTIGEKCVIGAGSLIMADAEPEGVYIGPTTERSRVPSTRLKKL
ncbi:acetyltransferase [uncultured Herbaspirillum sp.]|jgi:sugar O-acyltransferase (sialic acid O-acetyltransferase NeuD family)|uniref:acetyltransferase n=1 Tax=uncultured Herbaspirillum sp. TaxID=160236 RepID=UPI00258350B1|nr:acetyltransferase [uncultured Herbaspirillum sp.]